MACICGSKDDPGDEPLSVTAAKAAKAKPKTPIDVTIKVKLTLPDGAEHSVTAQPYDKINCTVLSKGDQDYAWNLAEVTCGDKTVDATKTWEAAGISGSADAKVLSVKELSAAEMIAGVVEDLCDRNPGMDKDKALKGATYNEDGTLKRWDLKIMGIKELPDSLCSVVTTDDFNLNENKLQNLPKRFGHIKCGGKLDLSNNALKTLPSGLDTLTVKTLRIEDNKLTKLPEDFYKIHISRNLLLGYNNIKELGAAFADIDVGNEIHVYGNPCVSQKTKVDWPKLKGKILWNDPN